MRIGELSERTGVSVRMLRHYETQGLLHPARRASGYRDYGPGDVEAVRRILLLNRAGIPLDRVRSLLNCVTAQEATVPLCDTLRSTVYDQLCKVEAQMEALGETQRLLSELLRP